MKTFLNYTFLICAMCFLSGCAQPQLISIQPFEAQNTVFQVVTSRQSPETGASYLMLGSRPGFLGQVVAYWMCRPATTSAPATTISGYEIVQKFRGQGGNSLGGIEFEEALPATDSLIEFIAHTQTQGSKQRNILFGRILSPEVRALEIVYADDQPLRWQVVGNEFLLFRQEPVDWTELRILGENDRVLKTYDLTHQNPTRSERDERGESNCPRNALPIATAVSSPTPTTRPGIDFSKPTPWPATAEASPQPTLSAPTEPADFCPSLAQSYSAASGFQTYCDNYGFAFDYPLTWRITYVAGSPDTPGTSTILVRRAQRFESSDMSNYIRVDTYRMPAGSTLAKQAEQFWSYPSREILDQPYDIRIGGQPAEVIINRWHQDYSAVYLFFQHGAYYSIMEIKAISHTGLDTNWEIAQSLQTPGAGSEGNMITQNLIDDSHKLLP